jgi:hypothetical protein
MLQIQEGVFFTKNVCAAIWAVCLLRYACEFIAVYKHGHMCICITCVYACSLAVCARGPRHSPSPPSKHKGSGQL